MAKMSSCQKIAGHWRAECKTLLERPPGEDEDRDWKALALLTDAYGEWNVGGEAKEALQQALWVHSVLIRYNIPDRATAKTIPGTR